MPSSIPVRNGPLIVALSADKADPPHSLSHLAEQIRAVEVQLRVRQEAQPSKYAAVHEAINPFKNLAPLQALWRGLPFSSRSCTWADLQLWEVLIHCAASIEQLGPLTVHCSERGLKIVRWFAPTCLQNELGDLFIGPLTQMRERLVAPRIAIIPVSLGVNLFTSDVLSHLYQNWDVTIFKPLSGDVTSLDVFLILRPLSATRQVPADSDKWAWAHMHKFAAMYLTHSSALAVALQYNRDLPTRHHDIWATWNSLYAYR